MTVPVRLLHFVRNDTSCQIASSRSLSRTFVVRGSSQRHLGVFFRDLKKVLDFFEKVM